MTGYVIKFGVGGVQEFIAQSRTLRDLAAGSMLIGEIIRRAAQSAPKLLHGQLIYPVCAAAPSLPHQFVLTTSLDQEALVKAAKAVVEDALQCWTDSLFIHQNRTEILKHLRKPSDFQFLKDPDLFAAQSKACFEFYWVAQPFEEYTSSTYKLLQRRFDHRRLSRTFDQLPQKNPVWPTCSVCGVRNAVLIPPDNASNDPRKTVSALRERLCAVCVGRRLYSKAPSAVPSTHRLATDRFFRDYRLAHLWGNPENEQDGTRYENWKQVLNNWEELAAWKSAGKPDDDTFRLPPQSVKSEFDNLREADLKRIGDLPKYYAIIAFDGDQMGRWMSGEWFDKDALRARQSDLSTCLQKFAKTARDISRQGSIDEERIVPVYLGGDDGLLVCALDWLLEILVRLQKAWEACVEKPLRNHVKGNKRPTFTLHASVVHLKEPLQPSISRLQRLLDQAKNRVDGDAFSIHVDVHSGAEATMVAKWCELDSLIACVEALSTWRKGQPIPSPQQPTKEEIVQRKTEILALSTGYNILAAAERLSDGLDDSDFPHKAFLLEAYRLVGRSQKTAQEPHLAAVKKWLRLRLETPPEPRDGADRFRRDEYLVTSLKVLLFLARQLDWK